MLPAAAAAAPRLCTCGHSRCHAVGARRSVNAPSKAATIASKDKHRTAGGTDCFAFHRGADSLLVRGGTRLCTGAHSGSRSTSGAVSAAQAAEAKGQKALMLVPECRWHGALVRSCPLPPGVSRSCVPPCCSSLTHASAREKSLAAAASRPRLRARRCMPAPLRLHGSCSFSNSTLGHSRRRRPARRAE